MFGGPLTKKGPRRGLFGERTFDNHHPHCQRVTKFLYKKRNVHNLHYKQPRPDLSFKIG
jgi:hypothetical protein